MLFLGKEEKTHVSCMQTIEVRQTDRQGRSDHCQFAYKSKQKICPSRTSFFARSRASTLVIWNRYETAKDMHKFAYNSSFMEHFTGVQVVIREEDHSSRSTL